MTVRLSRRAVHRLTEIADYLHARNPRAALEARTAIQDCFDLLERYPHLGRPLRSDDQTIALRVMAVPRWPYLIYYQVEATVEVVTIVTIRHAAQRRLS
ncbi:type II toxin-antitoxin system RelE/ParE family toxin [Methylobacterium sp. GC_Met_2]|uniref:type II toxin-antitoxin system RelE/ParE family toxin n=1 Tax=Methylobacterium sp. GC_Met_2 TaxID=2937376 RepID=UPI00226B3A50|nr:type II toxin-antitoxin system RelE/ParE family toxin [Methylobacterium sp. GC_Met_2]